MFWDSFLQVIDRSDWKVFFVSLYFIPLELFFFKVYHPHLVLIGRQKNVRQQRLHLTNFEKSFF